MRIRLVAAAAAAVLVGAAVWVAGSRAAPMGEGLTAHRYTAAGHSLNVVSAGDASLPPVLFIHGSPGSWDAWRAYLEDNELADRAHLLAVDRPGFGASEPGQPEPSLEVQAAAAVAALSLNRSGQPAVVVGHSLGGPVAARLAMDHPEQVRGLLLLAPSISPALEQPRWYNRAAASPWFRWAVPRDARTSNDEIMPLRPELEAMMPMWSTISAPTILIHGDRDRLVPVENADFAEKMLAPEMADIRRIEGGNHLIPWNASEAVYDALDTLLAPGDL